MFYSDSSTWRALLLWTLTLVLVLSTGCDNSSNEEPPMPPGASDCIVPESQISLSTVRDGIPALQNPPMIDAQDAAYLKGSDLVLGIQNGDFVLAIPHNILNWHEIVNLDAPTLPIAVTFCPLTGSGLAFDRSHIGGAEFGVSGLLWLNNNVLYDRREPISLWSQMLRAPICGEEKDSEDRVPMYPIIEMTWAGWKEIHPNTKVLSDATGFDRSYEVDLLEQYKEIDNTSLFWPMPFPFDSSRPPKERVLGIPDGGLGGIAFPFDELDFGASIPMKAIHRTIENRPVVVFYDREKRAAAAFSLTGKDLHRSFIVQNGQILDDQTGSLWRIDGRAMEGPLAGEQLQLVSEAYVSYWFAWVAFQPQTEIWIDPERNIPTSNNSD